MFRIQYERETFRIGEDTFEYDWPFATNERGVTIRYDDKTQEYQHRFTYESRDLSFNFLAVWQDLEGVPLAECEIHPGSVVVNRVPQTVSQRLLLTVADLQQIVAEITEALRAWPFRPDIPPIPAAPFKINMKAWRFRDRAQGDIL
jgi:hypothetical protein